MGLISNQWVNTGDGRRRKKYMLTKVEIGCVPGTDTFSKVNQINVSLNARRYDGAYQSIHLDEQEALMTVNTIIAGLSDQARERVAVAALMSTPVSIAVADEIAGKIVSSMSSEARERLLIQVLKKLTHSRLLRLLARVLSGRFRLPKEVWSASQ